MKKEVMKEMQEKMDYFNNMVVVSKGGATPKKQLKRKVSHNKMPIRISLFITLYM